MTSPAERPRGFHGAPRPLPQLPTTSLCDPFEIRTHFFKRRGNSLPVERYIRDTAFQNVIQARFRRRRQLVLMFTLFDPEGGAFTASVVNSGGSPLVDTSAFGFSRNQSLTYIPRPVQVGW